MAKKKVIQIVAKNALNYIGKNGGLMYELPDDMKRFQKLTTGKVVIMGHNTFLSIKKPLKNRFNIVVSSEPLSSKFDNVSTVRDVKEAIEIAKNLDSFGDEIFIIGGGKIYKDSLELSDELWITSVRDGDKGDVKYPAEYRDLFDMKYIVDKTSAQIDGDYITSYQYWFRKKRKINLGFQNKVLSLQKNL